MAEPAMPPNPNTAATMAITKKVTAQFNIEHSFHKKTIAAFLLTV